MDSLGAAKAAAHEPLSRRSFLQIGTLGIAGLTLPRLLQAEASAGHRSSPKSVILIYLVGGPPHQDMFDLKPDAPEEIAGPWRPIATNVTGIQICEALPRLARIMDKLVVVRSLVGNQADHDAIQVFNGHHPAQADAVRRLAAVRLRRRQAAGAGRSGRAAVRQPVLHLHARPVQRARPRLPRPGASPRSGRWARRATTWSCTASRVDRLADRKTLLRELRRLAPRRRRQRHDARAWTHFTEQAFGLLTSSRLAEALDLSKEDPRDRRALRHRRPEGVHGRQRRPARAAEPADGPPADRGRRAASSRSTTASGTGTAAAPNRTRIFSREAEDFPVFDQCVSALVEDLHQRGPGPGLHRRRHGRVRPHAARSAPRSAATTGRRSTAPCWPAAA